MALPVSIYKPKIHISEYPYLFKDIRDHIAVCVIVVCALLEKPNILFGCRLVSDRYGRKTFKDQHLHAVYATGMLYLF